MNANDTVIAQGKYIGATSDELAGKDAADKVAAGVSQKALFRRRGEITLYRDRLVLTEWAESGELVLRPADIRSVDVRFTELYGRFIGGLLNAGKPLILQTAAAGEMYLLIDRKEFMETTDDRRWATLLTDWQRSASSTAQ
ncbi:hypothetical protein GCM10009765_06020 [Fodinicola feengrottensis]|uniref:GRAM domain-containing protein n=1 Tax=Fodinicola feengrottensis TaxID=435914 RepID=A0ABP4RSY0_9ACTN